jgi:hypothetical protein
MPGVQQGLIGSYAAAAPAGDPLPVGAILIFNRTSGATPIPANFSLYTDEGGSIEGYLIRGGTSVSRSTGSGNPDVQITPTVVNLGTGGDHTAPGSSGAGSPPSPGWYGIGNAGGHVHSITIPSGIARPFPYTGSNMGQQMPLIRCNTEAVIPANCLVFSSTNALISGFSRYSGTQPRGVFSVRPAPSGVAQAIPFPFNLAQPGPVGFGPNINTSSNGDHQHFPMTALASPNNAPPVRPGYFLASVAHTHPAGTAPFFNNIGVWQQYKHLIPNISNDPQGVQSGMIIMFNGNSVPAGWLLCDGTNGTPDMRNFFLGYDNAQNNTNVITSRPFVGEADPGPSTTNSPLRPAPDKYDRGYLGVTLPPASNSDWTHTHFSPTAPNQPRSPGPARPTAHLNTAIPHTHSVPPTSFLANMPANFGPIGFYQPAHVVLLFLQKS